METTTINIAECAYSLPEKYVRVQELSEQEKEYIRVIKENAFMIPKLRDITLEEVDGVHEFTTETPGETSYEIVKGMLEKNNVEGGEISLIVDCSTVSRDKNGISLCYRIQDRLNAKDAITLCIGNGSCASMHLGFMTAASMLKTHEEKEYAILFSEDRIRGRRITPSVNVLGDGASAILLMKNRERFQIVDTSYRSMGQFRHILGIHHWEEDNFNGAEFEQKVIPMHYKVIFDLVDRILKKNRLSIDDIDLILYQNMSLNDYDGFINSLGIDKSKVYRKGLKGHGHIFGSDLVINFCLAHQEQRMQQGSNVLLISSGAGFSWGVTLVRV